VRKDTQVEEADGRLSEVDGELVHYLGSPERLPLMSAIFRSKEGESLESSTHLQCLTNILRLKCLHRLSSAVIHASIDVSVTIMR